MKQIELTQGKVAIVDDEDYEWLNQWKWYALKHRSTFYAVRNVDNYPKQKKVYMHREILKPATYLFTDHINRNGLDNQRHNLRPVTNAQNQWNQIKKYNGVTWHKKDQKWVVRIRHNGKRFYLGGFDNRGKAIEVYKKAIIRLRA